MPEQNAIARILSLLRILADPVNDRDIAGLATLFDTSVKTIRRDINELRTNGVNIHEATGPFNRKTYPSIETNFLRCALPTTKR